MRAVVQRVTRANVRVAGEEVAAIGPGLLVLLGVHRGDEDAQADRMAQRLLALRVFADADRRMNEPLGAAREVLCVPNFTVAGDTRKGARPSYAGAADPLDAQRLWERCCDALGAARGVFGAHMEVGMTGDGPVTVTLDVAGSGV